MSKYKLINDPVHGFITIPNALVFQLIESIYFQRLRRISQMAMASYVYPGATHTRFHHALGAMFLMQKAIDVLRKKNITISKDEEEGALCAILLHDVGHGPYSHALEYVMTQDINHEFFSELIMARINEELGGRLNLAIEIFKGTYPKQFLHQLVSSQLDVDRLDYLARDSFYSGVTEGKISNERIISMLNVVNDRIVIEEKGYNSIEKFIVSRHLMYWQVYLHKTVICAEQLLVKAITRARELAMNGKLKSSSKQLNDLLTNNWTRQDFLNSNAHLDTFCALDDFDVMFSIKQWQMHDDFVLSTICKQIIERHLPKIKLHSKEFSKSKIQEKQQQVMDRYHLSEEESSYFVWHGSVSNQAYKTGNEEIIIVYKNGKLKEMSKTSSDIITPSLTVPRTKHFLCYPKTY